jgi:hypothetical protein
MPTLNLRSKVLTPVQTIVELFNHRSGNVKKKTTIEAEITNENSLLINQLRDLLKPIASRTGIGFNLNIKDEEVEISAKFSLPRPKKKEDNIGVFRVSITTIPIKTWMQSTTHFNSYIKVVEKYVRFLGRVSRKEVIRDKVLFADPHVTVSINTRNRYFE